MSTPPPLSYGISRPLHTCSTSHSGCKTRLDESLLRRMPPQVRLVARISKTGSAQKQEGDFQVELPGVKTGVQGVVLNITGRIP